METPIIDMEKLQAREKEIGCKFCEDGKFAEMIQSMAHYKEQTQEIEGITFGFYQGDIQLIKDVVALVDTEWVQYFGEKSHIFCAFDKGAPVSFCSVSAHSDCILKNDGAQVGSIGCVGTIPSHRKKGIGLRMVDLATVYLKNQGCQKVSISYTHVYPWYSKLGYQTYAKFSVLSKE